MGTPFHYFPLGTPSGLIFSWCYSTILALLSTLRILIGIAFSGSNYFQVKDRTGKNRPKILDQYGNHHFIHLKNQNIQLHYVSNDRTDKQLMLFVHGFPECWFSWRHQMKAFDKDYHVVSMSLRGYCESDAPKGVKNYALKEMVSDVSELIENLVTKEHPKCILVGHDWGGVITWATANIAGGLIEKHIVMNAPHGLDWEKQIETSWIQFIRSWYKILFNFPIIPEIIIRSNDFAAIDKIFKKFTQNPDEIEAYKYCLSANSYSLTAAINYYRASVRGYSRSFNQEYRLQNTKIDPETIVIWAKKDLYLNSSLANDGIKRCRKATIEFIDDCSHFLQVEQPDTVCALMRKHLK